MKTPQEKKRLSYAKDRRNTYGENSKATRKNIPRTKARMNRAQRHAQDQQLAAALVASGEDQLKLAEVRVRGVKPRVWRKWPDQPLGEVLSQRAARRRGLNQA